MRKQMITFPNLNNNNVNDHYSFGDELGSGAFSVVYVGNHIKTKVQYAIKVVDKEQMNREEMLDELFVMSKLDHPNIVKFKEIFDGRDKFYVVMELITGGELFDRIIELRRYTEKDASHVMAQALAGLKHMHDRHLVHRDLKPENLLLSSKNPDATVKIADFGFACECKVDTDLDEMLGTPPYFAPELSALRHHPGRYGKPVDVWAMGVILYILLSGFHPFQIEDEEKMLNNIQAAKWDWLGPNWDKVSDSAKDLIKKMMEADPKKRYTVDQCIAHPWMLGSAPDAELDAIAKEISKFQAKKKLKGAILGVIANNKIRNLISMNKANRSKSRSIPKVTLKVISGDDLAPKDTNGKSDPYLKIFYGLERYKTSIQRKTLNPKWRDEDWFTLRYQSGQAIKVECWDYDRFGTDDFMGQFEINISSLETNKEIVHDYKLEHPSKEELKRFPNKKTENISGTIKISLLKTEQD